MQKLLIILVALAGFVGIAPAQTTKRAITHEDLWLVKRVGAPVPSPDGKWVVFTVTDPADRARLNQALDNIARRLVVSEREPVPA